MPLFEMPLETLKTYTGRNPRPDDFDTYWDDALKEMRGIDPQVAIEPAATFARRTFPSPTPRS
jgi:cephalosporin-C deacetylase